MKEGWETLCCAVFLFFSLFDFCCYLSLAVGRAEFSSGSEASGRGCGQTPQLGRTAAARLLGWSSDPHPAVEALKPGWGFTSRRFAVLVLLYSFPFSSPILF